MCILNEKRCKEYKSVDKLPTKAVNIYKLTLSLGF